MSQDLTFGALVRPLLNTQIRRRVGQRRRCVPIIGPRTRAQLDDNFAAVEGARERLRLLLPISIAAALGIAVL
jgi:hypothetical protein